jgi:NAD(P)-dependent dehydrogenase (short-subunit alcohol dehydrogenase family)
MKTVLITGANKGLGLEVARQLAKQGLFVYLGSRDKERGDNAINRLNDEGIENVACLILDVADKQSVIEAKNELEAQIRSLDILINNAGIGGELPQDFMTGNIENLRKIFDTNFFGVVQTTQAFLPLLQQSDHAKIINISSEVGSLDAHSVPGGQRRWDQIHGYGSSKTALNAFTLMLATELRDHNISVNSVTPGPTSTDLLGGASGFKPVEEGAAPVVKLATDFESKLTGKFIKEGGEAKW